MSALFNIPWFRAHFPNEPESRGMLKNILGQKPEIEDIWIRGPEKRPC